MAADELAWIEAEVNAVIRQNQATDTQEMAPEAAIEAGAMALFGEKYGESVRVLTLGNALGGEGAYSVELCGGTHVARTGDIALFRIVSEGGVAAGVRRIEGLTGESARLWLVDQAGVARNLADQFKVPVSEVIARVDNLQVQARKLEKELADARRQLAMGGGGGAGGASEIEEIGGVKVLARIMDGVGGKDLRPIAEEFKKQVADGVIALVGVAEGKAAVTVALTGSAVGKLNAAELAKAAVIAMGGQGAGGRPDFAQGGAPDASKAADGLAAVKAAHARLSTALARHWVWWGLSAPRRRNTDLAALLAVMLVGALGSSAAMAQSAGGSSTLPLLVGQGAEIATAVVYLASDEAAYVTGQTLHVNGGMHMG